MNISRSPNQATKTEVLKRQKFKCANKPGSNLTNILDYKCPFWEYRDGNFEDTDYEFDHIIEYSKGGLNDANNIQALCPNCHRKKTNNSLKKQEQTKIISNNDEEDDEKVIVSKRKLEATLSNASNAISRSNERVVEITAKNIEKDEIYNHLLKIAQKLKSERDLLSEEKEALKKSEDEKDVEYLCIKKKDFESEQKFATRAIEKLLRRIDKETVENKMAEEKINYLTEQINSLIEQNKRLQLKIDLL